MDLSSAINVIESVAGFTDADTAVGEAWAVVTTQLKAAPVPVSERLPGPGDCAPWPDDPDTQPWCWLGNVVDGGWEWHQRSPGILTFIRDSYTHWLPATDLPLPAAEAQP